MEVTFIKGGPVKLKKLYINLIVMLIVSIGSNFIYSARHYDNIPLKKLHQFARGRKIQKIRRGADRYANISPTRLSLRERLRAIKEIGRRKKKQSIKVLCELVLEGVGDRFSTRRGAVSREETPRHKSGLIRTEALMALRVFIKTPLNEKEKRLIISTLRHSMIDEPDEETLSTTCVNIGLFKDFLTDKQIKYFNYKFKRAVRKLVQKNYFRVITSMMQATKMFNQKSGIPFLQEVIRSPAYNRIKNIARKILVRLRRS